MGWAELMLLIPAIDLKDGHCVRLRQGRMDDSTVFSSDPVQMAGRWVNKGARRLHIVELNGAFVGSLVNAEIVTAITSAYPEVVVQIGGGIRDMQSVQFYIDAGVNYVIIGTQAVKEPEFVREACLAYPGQIIVRVDAINDKVATDGWTDVSALNAIELAQKFAGFGVAAIVYTDISLHHAVARDIRINDCCYSETSKFLRQLYSIKRRNIGPAIRCHLVVNCINSHDNLARIGKTGFPNKLGFLYCLGSDDDVIDPSIDIKLHTLHVSNTTTNLHNNFRVGASNGSNNFSVYQTTNEGAV
jgi:phosphoribosylformimino-5-aminoimidazole carboxamide ribotide isomerase